MVFSLRCSVENKDCKIKASKIPFTLLTPTDLHLYFHFLGFVVSSSSFRENHTAGCVSVCVCVWLWCGSNEHLETTNHDHINKRTSAGGEERRGGEGGWTKTEKKTGKEIETSTIKQSRGGKDEYGGGEGWEQETCTKKRTKTSEEERKKQKGNKEKRIRL